MWDGDGTPAPPPERSLRPVAAVLSSVAFGYVCVVLTYIWGAKVLDVNIIEPSLEDVYFGLREN